MTHKIYCLRDEEQIPQDGWPRALGVMVLGWLSPESRMALAARTTIDVFDLHDLLPDDGEDVTRRSFEDYLSLVSSGIEYLGANLFAPCSMVADVMIQPRIAYELVRWAAALDPRSELVFLDDDPLADFAELGSLAMGGPPIRRVQVASSSQSQSILHAIAEVRVTGHYGALAWRTFERYDRTHRYRAPRSGRRSRIASGSSLFFSSYVSYSRALRRYAFECSSPLWVFNSHQARWASGQPAPARFLWDLAPRASSDERRRQAAVVAEAGQAMLGVADASDGFPLNKMMHALPSLRALREDNLQHLASEAFLVDHALKRTSPREVWVGNQWGSEGLVVQMAARHGIPVTQVQHGVLERYYRWSKIACDRFLVWDQLWANVLTEPERRKAEVVTSSPTVRGTQVGDAITFFTQPSTPLVDNRAARPEIIRLLSEVLALGHPLRVRVHQSDSAADWVAAWKAAGQSPAGIIFEKETPLEDTLSHTKVALLLASTVFLDCKARGIPVVALGWFPIPHRVELVTSGTLSASNSRAEVLDRVRDSVGAT